MDSIAYHIIAPFLTLILTIAVFYLDRSPRFSNANYWLKQVFFGVFFGALAVFNISRGAGVANSRDVPIIISGLIFGVPAGLISSTITAVMCVFKEFNTFPIGISPVLNAVTALVAGVISFAMRKILFDDKKPALFYSLGIGVVTEVLYMLTIFMVNISRLEEAFLFVSKWAYIFILINGLTVMLAVLAEKLIAREKLTNLVRNKRFIAILAQRGLLNCVILAFFLSCFFTYYLQGVISKENCSELLRLNIEDAIADIYDASEERMKSLTDMIAVEVKYKDLDVVARENDIEEIVIVDWHGIITDSNIPEYIGFDMASGQQSAEFLVLLKGETYFVQEYQPISFGNGTARKYAGVALSTGGFLQIGYDIDDFQREIDRSVKDVTVNRHLGKNGFLLVIDRNFTIVSDGSEWSNNLSFAGMTFDTSTPELERFTANLYGEPYYCMYRYFDGYYVVALQPVAEVDFMMNMTIYIMTFMEIVIFFALFIFTYLIIKKLVVDNIHDVNESLSAITSGDLSVMVNVRNNEEFSALSDDINSTVDTLKKYISEASARIDRELELGKVIQESTLPTTFPPFPEYKQLDIFASMNAAKEVGGDFYDFYLLDDDNLAFLIADVSGKGVTGAMFMMKAKTLIKSFAGKSNDPAEILSLANAAICEGNEAEMFVTCWMAVLNFKTGKLSFANAGHNPPLIRRGGGAYEYLKSRPGFVLGGMDCIKYRKAEIDFTLGDSIFLYTDGVPEATDANAAMYDEERLINTVNSVRDCEAKEICHTLKRSVDEFVGDAPQFDDITMLCIKLLT